MIFGNSIQGKGHIGTEILCSGQIPLFITISIFSVVIVIVYGTFGPAVERGQESGQSSERMRQCDIPKQKRKCSICVIHKQTMALINYVNLHTSMHLDPQGLIIVQLFQNIPGINPIFRQHIGRKCISFCPHSSYGCCQKH